MADSFRQAIQAQLRRETDEEASQRAARLDALLSEDVRRLAQDITDAGHIEGWLPEHWSLGVDTALLPALLTVRYRASNETEGD